MDRQIAYHCEVCRVQNTRIPLILIRVHLLPHSTFSLAMVTIIVILDIEVEGARGYARSFKGFINKVKNITNSEKGVILFCRTGRRTTAIAKALEKTNDFLVIYNTKGIKEWISKGNKLVKYQ